MLNTHRLLGLVYFLWLAASANLASAQTACFCNFCDRSAPLVKNDQLDPQIDCVSEAGKHLRTESSDFRGVVNCAIQQWKCTDGTLAIGSSEAFLNLMTDNPEVFLR
jgi:hypothetical protein